MALIIIITSATIVAVAYYLAYRSPRDFNLSHAVAVLLLALMAAWGMADTARCLRSKWSLYHAGVLILLYSELMILALVVVLSIYP